MKNLATGARFAAIAALCLVGAAVGCGSNVVIKGGGGNGDTDSGASDDDAGGDDSDGGKKGNDASTKDSGCTGSGCSCPSNESLCGTSCVNLATDNNHCHLCGNACTGTKTCYDSTCTVVPPYMPTPRSALGVASGADGRVYAVGGWNGTNATYATLEIYSPTTNTWTTGAPMPTSRNAVTAVAGADGRIYAIGGITGDLQPPTGTVEIYDPTTNHWSTGPSLPTARCFVSAALGSDGAIYVIGGDNNGYSGSYVYSTNVDVLANGASSWTSGTALPSIIGRGGASLGPDQHIYAIGGFGGASYDTSAESWSTLPAMPDTVGEFAVVTGSDGLIYTIGGGQGLQVLGVVETFDTSSKTWNDLVPGLRYPRELHGAALGGDGRIYAVGGYTGTGVMGLTEVFVTNDWAP